jgi:hypothetical protein
MMTAQVALWPLRFLTRHPLMVGLPLTYASFAVAINVQMMLGPNAWGGLIFAVCFTPVLLCGDYIRAQPGTSVTLFAWFWCLLSYLAWVVGVWLQLPNAAIGPPSWYKVAIAIGFLISEHLARFVWLRLPFAAAFEGQVSS